LGSREKALAERAAGKRCAANAAMAAAPFMPASPLDRSVHIHSIVSFNALPAKSQSNLAVRQSQKHS
jgi:hypothetical protein